MSSNGTIVLPLEHFIVAVLPVALFVLGRDRRMPQPRLLAVVFLGSQFPDLVDKPLAHEVMVLPSGRVFLHSLPFAIPITLVVLGYGWRTGRLRYAGAFVFAYATHVVADTYTTLLDADPAISPDLLWPFVEPIPRAAVPHWAGPNSINIHLWTAFSVVVLTWVGYVLVRDVRRQLAGKRV